MLEGMPDSQRLAPQLDGGIPLQGCLHRALAAQSDKAVVRPRNDVGIQHPGVPCFLHTQDPHMIWQARVCLQLLNSSRVYADMLATTSALIMPAHLRVPTSLPLKAGLGHAGKCMRCTSGCVACSRQQVKQDAPGRLPSGPRLQPRAAGPTRAGSCEPWVGLLALPAALKTCTQHHHEQRPGRMCSLIAACLVGGAAWMLQPGIWRTRHAWEQDRQAR